MLHAFTGQNAFFGLNAQNACKAAAQQINAAGGIMGHPLSCADFDTKGDPADAVPVTNRMLVSSSHLVMVVGPDGSDIPSVLPLLEQAKVPEMNTVGDPRYDKQTSPDFWRLTPSDSTQAPALAYYAYHRGFTKVAEVFTSDLSSQTTTAPFQSTYARLGGTIVKKLTIAPDQASYQTEVAQVLASPPAGAGRRDGRADRRHVPQRTAAAARRAHPVRGDPAGHPGRLGARRPARDRVREPRASTSRRSPRRSARRVPPTTPSGRR